MTRLFRQFFAVLCLGLGVLPAWSADPGRLPIDPDVIVKKLPNGLTYYIRANKKPENRAQFHLAINAGSILETEKTQGLATKLAEARARLKTRWTASRHASTDWTT